MRSLVSWFIGNPIAANILMLALLLGGFTSYGSLKREVFPGTDVNFIQVHMNYPGAAPTEVEQQIVVRIEEAISSVSGIFQITSESHEGVGIVNIEVTEGHDVKEVLNEIKTRVDAIITFPASSERPIIQRQVLRDTLMWFNLSGDADMATLKDIAYRARDEMPLLEGISEVKVVGMYIDEMAIEISENNLRRFNLTFDDVADAIRRSSVSLPAGTIKSTLGNIQIQTREQAYSSDDFANIVVRSFGDGSQLLLQDIANINDGYTEQDR
jgi:multidrug efflux pump subunit AcrB